MKAPFPACTRHEPYAFVSYAHADAETVYPDLLTLHEAGAELWYDEGIEPGSAWREELGTAISECQTFLFFLSERSLQSRHCRQELDFALETERPIIVVQLEEVELSAGLRMSLNNRQAIMRYALGDSDYRRKLVSAVASPSNSDQTVAGTVDSVPATDQPPFRGRKKPLWIGLAALLAMLLGVSFWVSSRNPEMQPVVDPESEITSIAVLPLITAANTDHAYLGTGIAEALMTALHDLDGMRVANRGDSFRHSASGKTVVQIGESLGVDGVLSGRIDAEGEHLRISITLAGSADGFERWSELVEADAADPFSLQRQVADRVIARFTGNDVVPQPDAQSFGTSNPEAYRLGQQGMQLAGQRGDPDALQKAIDLLEQALALDPSYHELYLRLLSATYVLGMHKREDRTEEFQAILVRARASGAPDETLRTMERSAATTRGDLFQAERLERESLIAAAPLKWNPLTGFAGPKLRYAYLLAVGDHHTDAAQYLQTLAPLANSNDQQGYIEQFLFLLKVADGRYSEAVAALQQCRTQAGLALGGGPGCVPLLVRIQRASGDVEGAAATVAAWPDHPAAAYLDALVRGDDAFLSEALDGFPPQQWLLYFKMMNDNGRHAEAADFWRERFPFGGVNFLWDTVIPIAAVDKPMRDSIAYRDLLAYYGVTKAWKRELCKGVHSLESTTGIRPVCEYE